jgi:hypothetical protein
MDRKDVCAAVTIGTVSLFMTQSLAAGEVIHLPPQAVGALGVSGSTTASAADFRFIPDTIIDRVYEVRIAPDRP